MLATNSSFEKIATKNRDVGLQGKKIVTTAVEHEMPPTTKKNRERKEKHENTRKLTSLPGTPQL